MLAWLEKGFNKGSDSISFASCSFWVPVRAVGYFRLFQLLRREGHVPPLPAAQDWLLRALTEAKKSCELVFLAVLLFLLGQAPAALWQALWIPHPVPLGSPSQKCIHLSLEVTLGSPALSSGLCPSLPAASPARSSHATGPCHGHLGRSKGQWGLSSTVGSSSTGLCPHAPQQGSDGHPGKVWT